MDNVDTTERDFRLSTLNLLHGDDEESLSINTLREELLESITKLDTTTPQKNESIIKNIDKLPHIIITGGNITINICTQ